MYLFVICFNFMKYRMVRCLNLLVQNDCRNVFGCILQWITTKIISLFQLKWMLLSSDFLIMLAGLTCADWGRGCVARPRRRWRCRSRPWRSPGARSPACSRPPRHTDPNCYQPRCKEMNEHKPWLPNMMVYNWRLPMCERKDGIWFNKKSVLNQIFGSK